MTWDSTVASYVYIAQPEGMPVWKVGHTKNPAERLASLQSFAPRPMSYVRILMVESQWHAKAFERYALSWLGGTRSHGEWCECIDAINAQFDEFCPAIDVTDEFSGPRVLVRKKNKLKPIRNLQAVLSRADDYLADAIRFKSGRQSFVSPSAGVSSDVSQLDSLAGNANGSAATQRQPLTQNGADDGRA